MLSEAIKAIQKGAVAVHKGLQEVEEELTYILNTMRTDKKAALGNEIRSVKVSMAEAKTHMEFFVHTVDQFSDTSSIFREL